MSEASDVLSDPYISVLEDYFAEGGEDALTRAYELGREAMLAGVGVLQLTETYHHALAVVLGRAKTLQKVQDWMQMASVVFAEILSPFEMFQRGFQEIDALHRLNEELAVYAAQFGRFQVLTEDAEGMQEQVKDLHEAFDDLGRRMQQRTSELARAGEDLRVEIAERRRVEETLRESQEQFRMTFEQAAVGIAHVGSDGRWLRVNRKLCEIVGYSREELLEGAFQDITHPDDLGADLAYVRRMLAGELSNYSMEKRYFRKDGSPVWINLTVALMRKPSGEPKYFISVVEDITERKQAEEEIRKLNAELERRVLERTAQFEAANQELEAFSYSVSHDLRAPLRSINGFSQALLEDCADALDAEGKALLQRVRAASQRMAQLIDDLLNLSRVTRSEMRSETVDLSALAQAIAAELQRTEPQRRVEWDIVEHLRVQGDGRLLRIALENLLGNAWKFTSKQEQARIELGGMEEAGRRVYYVRDNGAGFDMAYADKLFGAFQRLHGMAEFPGTGIGLATVQRIVHRHGGQIRAEGAVGKGAAFYFTL